MRRLFTALVLVMLISPAVIGLGLAAGDQPTDGPFDRDALLANGVHDEEAPDSVRMVGDPVRGSIAVRHIPASPLQSEYKFLKPGEEIKTDRIQLYSTAFGEATGEYQLVIVQWRDKMRTTTSENGSSSVPVAADQTVQRVDIALEEGYSTTNVQLASNYNNSKQVTMWLEQDGERIDGVTWRYSHKSVASGQAVDIQSQADAWWYALKVSTLPGIGGIIAGLSLARLALRKIGRGPGWGMGVWGLIGGIGLLGVVGGLYYEVAEVLAHFQYMIGLSLFIVAFGGGMRMHPPLEWLGFEQSKLTDAVSLTQPSDLDRSSDGEVATDGGTIAEGGNGIPSDSYFDELYEDLPMLPTIMGEDGMRRVPITGIGPAFARFFAEPAKLDLQEIRTRVSIGKGKLSQKIYVDPDADNPVEHTPAHLKRRMPVWHRLEDDADLMTKALYGILTLAVLALPAIGFQAGQAIMQTPVVGAFIGLLFLVVESYGAEDGHIEVTPAPIHFRPAKVSLTVLQNEYAVAQTVEDFQEIAWKERGRTILDAMKVESDRDKTLNQMLNEAAVGMDLDVVAEDPEDGEIDDILGGEGEKATATDGGEDDE